MGRGVGPNETASASARSRRRMCAKKARGTERSDRSGLSSVLGNKARRKLATATPGQGSDCGKAATKQCLVCDNLAKQGDFSHAKHNKALLCRCLDRGLAPKPRSRQLVGVGLVQGSRDKAARAAPERGCRWPGAQLARRWRRRRRRRCTATWRARLLVRLSSVRVVLVCNCSRRAAARMSRSVV